MAYGSEEDWQALSDSEREKLLASDQLIRDRGALVAAVENDVVTVRAWNGTPEVSHQSVVNPQVPLAGFAVIKAEDVREVIELVARTPCARAKGVIELRPINRQQRQEPR